jgi:hypothetical protein
MPDVGSTTVIANENTVTGILPIPGTAQSEGVPPINQTPTPQQEIAVTEEELPLPPAPPETEQGNNPLSAVKEGQKADEKPSAGRPCDYCRDKERVDKIIKAYMEKTTNSAKPQIPFIEELCMELDIIDETLTNWTRKLKDDGSLEHPGLIDTHKKLKMIQKYRLMQRTVGRYNPTGAIFQLKANHGMIETEKQILAGVKDEPLQVEIIEEKVQTHGE